MPAFPPNHALFSRAERRRSRTYQPWGYHGLPVLKTGWATGPVPLQGGSGANATLAAMVPPAVYRQVVKPVIPIWAPLHPGR